MEEIEKWTLEDGRRAEKRVTVNKSSVDGENERVIELHVEDHRPLKLQQRVVEKTKPVVVERSIETIDTNTGNIVDKKIESLEPKVKMTLVEHIVKSENELKSQKDEPLKDEPTNLSKQDMVDLIVSAIKASQEVTSQSTSKPIYDKSNQYVSNKLQSLGIVDEISNKLENISQPNNDYILPVVLIILELVALGYVFYIM